MDAPWRTWTARAALAVFALLSLWLAAAPAVQGSRVVLATAGGSPDWLLGPLRFAGSGTLAGGNAGWTYYGVLMAAMVVFAVIVWLAPSLSINGLWGAIVGLNLLFLLAPPLLSQDVFSYIAYARLGVEHGLNPYSHRPFDIPGDPVFGFAGSKDAVDVYGPFFTLLTYPLAWLSVPAAFWVLKFIAFASTLGIVATVRSIADRVGALPTRAIALVGLCPATLVHVVAGAHNEALTMLILMGGVSLAVSERERVGGFVSTLACGIKASAAVPLPFMLAAARNKLQMLAGMVGAFLLAVVTALIAFGPDALNGLNLISSNQNRSSRWSLPHRTVDGIDAIFGSVDRAAATDVVRGISVAILAVAVLWLLRRSWKQPETWLENAGWATLGVLLASAWLVPWYLLWLLPFAALSKNRWLVTATVVFAGYTLAIAIPY
ncbi:MAG: polyprenol phosphomannose-dependent alpha 1,6 mannosyltransferase MptB [Solirubrobacterales bacterium]